MVRFSLCYSTLVEKVLMAQLNGRFRAAPTEPPGPGKHLDEGRGHVVIGRQPRQGTLILPLEISAAGHHQSPRTALAVVAKETGYQPKDSEDENRKGSSPGSSSPRLLRPQKMAKASSYEMFSWGGVSC